MGGHRSAVAVGSLPKSGLLLRVASTKMLAGQTLTEPRAQIGAGQLGAGILRVLLSLSWDGNCHVFCSLTCPECSHFEGKTRALSGIWAPSSLRASSGVHEERYLLWPERSSYGLTGSGNPESSGRCQT